MYQEVADEHARIFGGLLQAHVKASSTKRHSHAHGTSAADALNSRYLRNKSALNMLSLGSVGFLPFSSRLRRTETQE